MRTETCITCDAPFTPRPDHPAWERAHCKFCYPVVSQAHRLAYVAPAEVGRADRLEDV